ncbi:unnamed protein product [Moneuplotes crassus]|uniref:Uncharacterized protein n=1 Tax=Euplotes crassus TaxID=5936 RepID=A0AAD1XV79_EUPCR|nr:unnamed protein product [Moneuplotes crassus]
MDQNQNKPISKRTRRLCFTYYEDDENDKHSSEKSEVQRETNKRIVNLQKVDLVVT